MTMARGEPSPIYAIIPAAGTGSRMKTGRNKQFLLLGRFPVIIRTLRVFESHPRISGYLVVAASDDQDEMNRLVASHNLVRCLGVVAGGATRQDSVANGLAALADRVDDVCSCMVLVHDGARCFIPPDAIDRVIAGICQHGACGAAVPVKDTIKSADASGRVRETLDRSRLWSMQTPQGAWYPLLRAAYDQAAALGWQTTDDLSVLEKAGNPVYLVSGDTCNIKLTTPEDRLLAERLADLEDGLAEK
jgi:2-C-methyl-D-erythritol 4-phosphate cytidylyltransferase